MAATIGYNKCPGLIERSAISHAITDVCVGFGRDSVYSPVKWSTAAAKRRRSETFGPRQTFETAINILVRT
jgi:hypothetical protein